MAKSINFVICNSGDGSSHIRWVKDYEVIDKMQALADDGDETYASGDGLQLREIKFPDDFDLDAWIKLNHIKLVTIKDMIV